MDISVKQTIMKVTLKQLVCLMALAMVSLGARAENLPPVTFNLSFVAVDETRSEKPQMVFVLSGPKGYPAAVFKTAPALEKYLRYLPKGSTVEYYGQCTRPNIAEEDTKTIQAACEEAGLKFIHYLAG